MKRVRRLRIWLCVQAAAKSSSEEVARLKQEIIKAVELEQRAAAAAAEETARVRQEAAKAVDEAGQNAIAISKQLHESKVPPPPPQPPPPPDTNG
jgi:hypothetical protein